MIKTGLYLPNIWLKGSKAKMEREHLESALNWIVPCIKSRSVKGERGFCFRIEKARQQQSCDIVDRETIISYVNDFLASLGMNTVDKKDIEVSLRNKKDKKEAWEKHKNSYSKEDRDNIVWIKFVDDGHIGVIGTSSDIFKTVKETIKETTADIIIRELGLKWDNKALLFPLIKKPDELCRSDIESGIGNYLINKGVPVLDFYSHNF